MQRMLVPALLTSALFAFGPASLAAATPLFPSYETRVAPPAERAAPPVRYAQARGHMGGGLLEALFSGQSDDPTPRNYRSAPAEMPPFYRERSPSYQVDPFAPRRYPQYARGEPAEESQPERAGVDPKYRKQVVDYDGKHRPGTIIIDTPNRFLYLVQPGGRALRYGIGVGRPGFTWAGGKTVTMKKEWPDWRPPAEMLKRRPDLPTFMAGGPDNPLGARALYLGSSLYRIHGSNEPWTIGRAVSSGCIRMRNEDVTDLYERVKVGTRVIVM